MDPTTNVSEQWAIRGDGTSRRRLSVRWFGKDGWTVDGATEFRVAGGKCTRRKAQADLNGCTSGMAEKLVGMV